jgi:fructokinase
VINIVDPDSIVFGGGLSNIPALIHGAAAQLPEWVFSDCFNTPLKLNKWGDSSGVRGAAQLIDCPR